MPFKACVCVCVCARQRHLHRAAYTFSKRGIIVLFLKYFSAHTMHVFRNIIGEINYDCLWCIMIIFSQYDLNSQ